MPFFYGRLQGFHGLAIAKRSAQLARTSEADTALLDFARELSDIMSLKFHTRAYERQFASQLPQRPLGPLNAFVQPYIGFPGVFPRIGQLTT